MKADPKVLAMEFNVAQASLEDGALATLESAPVPVTGMTSDAFAPNFNVAPTHLIPAVAQLDGRNTLAGFSWGLVPSWAKDASVGARMINARAETVAEKPSYRKAVAVRRCLVPADGWYEWLRLDSGKQPYFFSNPDGSLLGFAAIYERWQEPAGGTLWSASILTTQATPDIAHIHDRMPLLVAPHLRSAWLEPGMVDVSEFTAAAEVEHVQFWPVTTAVGSVRNNRPELLDPVGS